MKKIILLLFIFLSFTVFGAKEDLYQLKIDRMLHGKTIIEIDKDKLYGSYTNNNEIKKIDRDIINKCVNLYQDKTMPENTEIVRENNIYYLLEGQEYIEDGRKADGHYFNIYNLQTFKEGELTEYYKYSNYDHRFIRPTIDGHYVINLFDNIVYDKYKHLYSFDRTYYDFMLDENKNLTNYFIYINDHIEQVAICSKLLKGYRTPVTVIIYKAYKNVKIFYPTGELAVEGNFECFSNLYYSHIYYPPDDPKISIAHNGESLSASWDYSNDDEDFTYKTNKLKIYNKDGTINRTLQSKIDNADPKLGGWYIITFWMNNSLMY